MVELAYTKDHREIYLVAESELHGLHPSGTKWRAGCPAHESSSTNDVDLTREGENAGWGHCFAAKCGATLLVEEWNQQAAANLRKIPGTFLSTAVACATSHTPYTVATPRVLKQLCRLHDAAVEQLQASARARAYLDARGVASPDALDLLRRLGVGYLPASDLWHNAPAGNLRYWCDRIVFPRSLQAEVTGFDGRALALWEPGMTEIEHKDLLDTRGIPRYHKAGTGFFHTLGLNQRYAIVVEGPFDALALLLAGVDNVGALCGSSLKPEKLPKRLLYLTLAYDADQDTVVGRKAMAERIDRLADTGIQARAIYPPTDERGGDWNERYRRCGVAGLSTLLQAPPMEVVHSTVPAEHKEIRPIPAKTGQIVVESAPVLPVIEEPCPILEAPELLQCHVCGTSIEDTTRDFFEAELSATAAHLCCSVCYDMTTRKRKLATVITATVLDFVRDYSTRLVPGARIAFDLETTGLDRYQHKIVTVQLGTPNEVYVLDVRGFYDLPEEERQVWREAFQQLFSVPGITWIGHNLKFDWLFLAYHFGVKPGATYDTMLAEQCMQAGKQVSLKMKDAGARYNIDVSKDEQLSTVDLDKTKDWRAPFSEAFIAYCRQDVIVPHLLYEQQQPLLERDNLHRVVSLENAALLAIIRMEARGALIDSEQIERIAAAKRQRQQELEDTLLPGLAPAYEQAMQRYVIAQQQACDTYKAECQAVEKQWMTEYAAVAGSMRFEQFYAEKKKAFEAEYPQPAKPKKPVPFKLSSNDHLITALAAIGVEVDDAQEATLESVAGKHAIIPVLIAWRKLQTSLNTFCSKLPEHIREDGRIHADFHNVVTGRAVTSNPNLQALPKARDGEPEEEDPRHCVVSAPGYKLLEADLSNIELRILAEVANDATMLRLFAEGKDLHAETAKLMFGLPADTDTKKHLVHGKPARQIAKTINFGLAYGMGPQGLANRTGVEVETAKELMKRYFATYRGVDAYLRRSGRDALKRGYAVSLSGRRRYFSATSTDNRALYGRFERAAKNYPIQATNADILKRALALLYERLPDDVYIVLTVHDEIILESPEVKAEEATSILQQCMLEACRDFLKEVAIPTPQVLVAGYWAKD